MHLIFVGLLLIFIRIHGETDVEKYSALREQCTRHPSAVECVELKTKFVQLIQKCQKITNQKQLAICKEVKLKLCAIFPTYCLQTTTTTTTRKQTKSKLKTTTTTTTTTSVKTSTATLSNDEFVKVPIDPTELRVRGEYCVRHGKEKKCQQLLNNLKTTYSTCNKKKSTSTQLDCHSFQTHLCQAFPKFPPCIKKTS